MHPRNRRVRTLSRRAWLIVALAAILLAFARRPVAAQPPLRSPLGYPDSQFVVMAISQTHSDPDPDHGKLWQLLDVLGIDAVEQYSNPTELNDLATSTLRKSSQKLISKFAPGEAGHGIEVQLYPFTSIDTAQSPLYVSKFIYRNGGVLVHNAVLGDSASGPYTEQRYDSAHATANQLIDSGVAFDWHAGQTLRSQIAAGDLLARANHPDLRVARVPFSIVAVGHLFAPLTPGIDPSTPLFRVELYQDVIAGDPILSNLSTTLTFANDAQILLATGYVTRGDFLAGYNGGSGTPLDEYRESVVITDSLLWRPDGAPGPFHPSQTDGGRRLEIKVYWLGGDPVALRSINIRDHIGQRVMGATQESIDYRDTIIRNAFLDLYGTTTPTSSDTLRRAWSRLYTGDEPKEIEGATYAYMDTMLLRRFLAVHAADSIRLFTGAVGAEPISNFYHRAVTAEVVPEMYGGWNQDTSRAFGIAYDGAVPQQQNRFDTPYWCMPRFREHNGGRWHNLMLLSLDSARSGLYTENKLKARIENYELCEQRGKLGWFQPTITGWPWKELPLQYLSLGAVVSRDSSRPMIATIGGNGYIDIRQDAAGNLDTIVKLSEPNEIRVQVGLALCYGARGIRYNVLGDFRDFLRYDSVHNHIIGGIDNFGLMGGHLGDTTIDSYGGLSDSTVFRLTSDWKTDSGYVIKLDSLYMGYRAHVKELESLNAWVHRVGRELCRLRWRDAYSMHMAYFVSGTTDTSVHPRPLPANEIVTYIDSYDPRTLQLDPASDRFVELGLFEKQSGSGGYDTNHVFVVNRRIFEAPADLQRDTSYRVLNNLSGTRTIRLKFHLTHPDATHYNFLRVTEVEPDTVHLPGVAASRTGLDTIVYGDSAVALTLRPGGGALLRVTYAQPGEKFVIGSDSRFNNQRKIVFDGKRYHAVYVKRQKYFIPFPAKNLDSAFSDHIFYRRSLPVDSTVGGIRWEPFEHLVSDTTSDTLARDNHFPSISVRVEGDRSTPVTNGDTVVTIVWSGYRSPTSHNVYLRTIRCNGMAISPDDTTANVPVQKSRGVEWVWRYNGLNDTLWGTPVVSRLDGGEMIAWSDSTQGIIAMFRRMGHGTNWWQPFGAGVKYLAPTAVDASPLTGAEIYPSMPAEGHVAGLDSTIGIVWQHILPGSQGSRIEYARIAHVAPFGANNILSYSQMFLNQGGDRDNRHPSIDATQDVWGGVQEGVTWESFETNPQDGRNMVDTWVHFTSLNTAYHDVTHQWTYNKAYINYPTGQFSGRPYFYYPNIASLNARSDVAHQHDSIYFALLMSPVGINPMRQAIMLYAAHGWRNFPANKYLYEPYLLGGPHANGSASPTRQPVRYAALYETTKGDSMALTTTRQFFAKSRPTGYAARGRQATFRISDSLNTGITARLHDVWYAGNDSAGAADMTARTDSNATTDTLSQVRALMRTGYFHAHDSTTIGCDLREMFYGDSAYADSTHIDFIVEVIDSATELAVGRLDSFRIASTTWLNDTVIMRTFDLLSGTYYVRMRIEPTNLPDSPSVHDSRYPVEDVASWVNDPPPLAKLRRMEGEAGASGRLSVWPNPARGHAEITFSVPARSRVSLSVYDISGGEVLRVVEPGAMEAGRYAVDIDGGHLAPGTYLVRMAYGERQLAEKLVIVR